MGSHADRVADALREALRERRPDREWTTERYVGRTPVDVAGEGEPLALVELEWRRADPVNNTVKLFRRLAADATERPAVVVQLFTGYYALADGGVSSKQRNAVFAGERLAQTVDAVDYEPLRLGIDPPKRGGSLPDGWRDAVEEAAAEVDGRL